MSMDALLYAVKDLVLQQDFGWDARTLDVMQDGKPPPKTANWFCAVHQAGERGDMLNALDEYYDFTLTLTLAVSGKPRDRWGYLLATRQVRTLARESGFNARAQQLKDFLHMNWAVVAQANVLLSEWYAQRYIVYGFAEPAHWAGTEKPEAVGGDWLGADTSAADVAITAEISFEGARRLQAITTYS